MPEKRVDTLLDGVVLTPAGGPTEQSRGLAGRQPGKEEMSHSQQLSPVKTSRVFLDTNVFLYAAGGETPYREPCRSLLSAIGEGRLVAVTSSGVLKEIIRVRARRVGLEDALHMARAAATLVAEVLPVTGDDVLGACGILEKHPGMTARDALHLAVMRAAGIRTVISVDADLDAVRGITRVDPARATVRADAGDGG